MRRRPGRLVLQASLLILLAVVTAAALIARDRLPAPVARPVPTPIAEPLVYMTDDGDVTTFWLVDANRPSRRRQLASVSHAAGWTGGASIAPNGKKLAYTLLARGQSDPDHAGQLWLLDTTDLRSTLLASGIDLRTPLVWSPGNDSVIYQTVADGQARLWSQAIESSHAQLIAEPLPGTVMFPFAAVAGGTLLAALFGPAGTDLIRLGPSGNQAQIAHLGDGTARNLALSPDGAKVGFLEVNDASGSPLSRGADLDLQTQQISRIPADWGEIVGLAWTPNGRLVAGSAGNSAGLRDESGNRIGPPVESGFEQPLAWSTSGLFLAIRRFTGASGNDPGAASDLVLNPDGSSFALSAGQPARFVGWIPAQTSR